MTHRNYIICLVFVISLFSCNKEVVIPTEEIPPPEVVIPPFLEEIDFVKTVGGTKNDVAKSVIKTTDGGYAIVGHTQSADFDISDKTDESFDFWMLKFSATDQLQFSKTFGGTLDDRGNDIVQTQDGGYAILGYSESSDVDVTENAGFRDYWITKLDVNGNLLWQKSFGYAGSDYGISMVTTSDNGYLLTGIIDVSASNGEGNSKNSQRHAGGDIWAIKLNANGDKLWSKYYGGSYTDTPNGVVQTPEGDYIIVGSSDSTDVDISNNKGTYDFWVLKISSTGVLLWEKNFGGSEIDEARAVTLSDDGNYIIVGDTRSNDVDVSVNYGGADLWIIKVSPSGSLLWQKTIGDTGFDVARSVHRSNNGYIIAGFSRSSYSGLDNYGQTDAWVLEVTSDGTLLWQKNIGGSDIDFSFDAVQLDNGNIIAVGETTSSDIDITTNKGFSDALIIKIK